MWTKWDTFFWALGVVAVLVVFQTLIIALVDNRNPQELIECLDRSELFPTTSSR